MAKKRVAPKAETQSSEVGDESPSLDFGGAETTGKVLVTFKNPDLGSAGAAKALAEFGAKELCSSEDYEESALDPHDVAAADGVYFHELGVAVLAMDPAQQQSALAAASDDASNILSIEPEYVNRTCAPTLDADYLRGYRDAINHLYDTLAAEKSADLDPEIAAGFSDTAQATWGLQATRVVNSSRSGAGLRVAVLDTGFDFAHPDFRGRAIVSKSFVPGQTPQDGKGHGTHCIGTALGPKQPPGGARRYGCAHQGSIFVGKVLSNAGSGADTGILAGINWAIANGCQIISMSLGAPTPQVSPAYTQVGQLALQRGCLIVAAAGNSADRAAGQFSFVNRPANSPTIMAVAALDSMLRMANFSARGTVPGANVDIAGPGVAVFSTVPMPTRYAVFSGTSMATPHVAGIAALWAQSNPALRGALLWQALIRSARRLMLPSADVGAGLVQAP